MTTLGLIILLIIGIVIYANIGYLLAHASLKYFGKPFAYGDYKSSYRCYEDNKWVVVDPQKLTLANWLLFPFFSARIFLNDRFYGGEHCLPASINHFCWVPPIYLFNQEENYKRVMLFVWPLKVAANAILVIPGLIVYAIYRTVRTIVRYFPAAITYPSRKAFKINHI